MIYYLSAIFVLGLVALLEPLVPVKASRLSEYIDGSYKSSETSYYHNQDIPENQSSVSLEVSDGQD